MRVRLIPVLQLDRNRRLVKTVRFGSNERTYIGDPFNVLRLFNEKEVDEIVVLDIDATVDGRAPDVGFCRELAAECFMPLAYGGGISTEDHCEQLNRVGIEKFVLGTTAHRHELVGSVSRRFGAQAVVACLDVRRARDGFECVVTSGTRTVPGTPVEVARALEAAGVGEIIVQSVDRDGTRTGYDTDLIRVVSDAVGVPVVALGGAGDARDLASAVRSGASAAASGSAFCFIGRLRAVLVTYPAADDRDRLLERAGR